MRKGSSPVRQFAGREGITCKGGGWEGGGGDGVLPIAEPSTPLGWWPGWPRVIWPEVYLTNTIQHHGVSLLSNLASFFCGEVGC